MYMCNDSTCTLQAIEKKVQARIPHQKNGIIHIILS